MTASVSTAAAPASAAPPAPPPSAERMRTLDAEFFFAEHRNVPLHIGSVAVFDGPAPSREDLMRLFEAKLPRVPRYRQVVRAAPFQLLRPVWADDQEFSIRHHIRRARVPAPGGQEQLRAVAARLFARPLDRRRPLWEEWLLDGLAAAAGRSCPRSTTAWWTASAATT